MRKEIVKTCSINNPIRSTLEGEKVTPGPQGKQICDKDILRHPKKKEKHTELKASKLARTTKVL